jgi:glycine cleavage system H protein
MAGIGQDEKSLRYKRARFITRFPTDRLYAASHFWLQEQAGGAWRIGFTGFAMRMLGEPVELEFQIQQGLDLELGQMVGWIEGFKAVTDLYSPMSGCFVGVNPSLDEDLAAVKAKPYGAGWLYEMSGEPGPDCVDARGYAALLDETIDRMTGDEA